VLGAYGRWIAGLVLALTLGWTAAAAGQGADAGVDPVIGEILEEGMDRSRVYPLAQVLLDSIGPRLTGTPQLAAAQEWLVSLYRSWGVEARNERYGTWKGWERGVTHVDLIRPRVVTLDAMLVGWSPGTDGAVEAEVVSLPPYDDREAIDRWRERVAGRFVLGSFPEPTCRPTDRWEAFGGPDAAAALESRRDSAEVEWQRRLEGIRQSPGSLAEWLEEAGAAGLLTSSWTGAYGARRVFGATTDRMPVLSVSCEDYGLLHRLADHDQGPVIRVDARSRELGEVPAMNTIATIPGTERPDEYVLLSAHLDSWDGAQGATDNGSGTIVMAEAMRLLRTAYPAPRRTIVVAHWGGEEQGLNGSRAFAADHPEVVRGLQALLNQDNGTGRVTAVGMQGLTDAGAHFRRWLEPVPDRVAGLDIDDPGTPGSGGSDYAAFTCSGAPSFGLRSESWDYGRYTWHTNLDTLDKLAFDNIRDNAVLVAMLAYMASEDPEFIARERVARLPADRRTGEPRSWPECRLAYRSWDAYERR
jgi:carboxypeptidase Q